MQHRARETAYAAGYGGAESSLILVSGRPAGRLLVWRSDLEHRLVDIAILPSERGRGLASAVLRSLIHEARDCAKPLRLTVATDNPAALRLYRRLGFEVTAGDAANLALEIR
jgi:ribosomal protein S18 acetylase RimI-like enzyme